MKKLHPSQLNLDFDKNVLYRQEETLLFLTYIRTTQHHDFGDFIRKVRKALTGKTFFVRRNPPKFCMSNSIVFLQKKDGKFHNAILKKIRCNSWTCPSCSVYKAIRTKYLLRDVIIINDLSSFLTLTLDPKKIPDKYLTEFKNNTHKYITKIFNAFLVSLKRDKIYIGKKVKYIWVLEYQKNGNAHLHIMFNELPHVDNVRKIWVRVGGGIMMKVLKIKSMEGISNYIGDYIVKGIKGTNKSGNTFKFFEKRYSISRSCVRPTNNVLEYLPDVTLKEKLNTIQSPSLVDLKYDLVMGEVGTYEL